MQVVLFSDIENKLIKIKKPVSVGLGNFRLNISYLSNDLLIQTPTLYNPFEVSRFDSIDLLINSPGISESFDSKISYINKLAQRMAKSYNLEFVSSIKSGADTRLRLNLSRCCSVFNNNKKKIDISSLKAKTMAKYIISPKYIWMNYISEKYGVYWEIIQIKVLENNYDIYMFIDEDVSNIPPPPPLPPSNNINMPDKYSKMIKMGIPEEAVKNKMILDGVEHIDQSLYKTNMRPDVNSLINAKSKLKPHKKKEKIIKKISYNGFKPPSIEELNNIRLKLNKI